MEVVRVEKNSNYTVISNYHLRDNRLKFQHVGLMTILLSLPDSWNFSIAGLAAIRRESKNTINSILKDLEEFGYVKKRQIRNENGTFAHTEYIVYEQPYLKNCDVVEPYPKKPYTEKPYPDFCTQINTNKINTNKSISKKESKKSFDDIISQNYKNEEIKSILGEFIQMRFRINKPITNATLQYLLDKLKKLSSNDKETIDIVKQSIVNSWADFYALKDKKTNIRPAEKKKVNQFNNFHQRDYTKEEINEWEIRMLTSK